MSDGRRLDLERAARLAVEAALAAGAEEADAWCEDAVEPHRARVRRARSRA